MENEIIKLMLHKWERFCEIGGGFDCDLDCYKEPRHKTFQSFMEWLKFDD